MEKLSREQVNRKVRFLELIMDKNYVILLLIIYVKSMV